MWDLTSVFDKSSGAVVDKLTFKDMAGEYLA
jgi:hypothetical protein